MLKTPLPVASESITEQILMKLFSFRFVSSFLNTMSCFHAVHRDWIGKKRNASLEKSLIERWYGLFTMRSISLFFCMSISDTIVLLVPMNPTIFCIRPLHFFQEYSSPCVSCPVFVYESIFFWSIKHQTRKSNKKLSSSRMRKCKFRRFESTVYSTVVAGPFFLFFRFSVIIQPID